MSALATFLTGMNAAGLLIAGLFFLRFWRRTRDTLFAAFALAFWLFAANQTMVALSGIPQESRGFIYLLRLAGFVVILVGILGKNLKSRRLP